MWLILKLKFEYLSQMQLRMFYIVAHMRRIVGVTEPFPRIVDFHQGSISSPYIFAFVLNELVMHETC